MKRPRLSEIEEPQFEIPDKPLPESFRTKIGKGKRMLDEQVDERTILARRFRELYEGFTDDLGGREVCSEAQKQIARRTATLSVVAEALECDYIAQTGQFHLDAYLNVVKTMTRTMSIMGIKRVMKDVTPESRLVDYLAQKNKKNKK